MLVAASLSGQTKRLGKDLADWKDTLNLQLPEEAAEFDKIVPSLLSVFDGADILALGESHWNKLDSELRIRLVRHPDFAKKARFIVVEFASTAQQSVLDRYVVDGEEVPLSELQQVWRNTTITNGTWESPVYAEFFATVREVNKRVTADKRIRILAGDPPTGSELSRDASAVSVLKEQVLDRGGKALVVYGSGHLQLQGIGGIAQDVQARHLGRIFVVDTLGGPYPEYEKFERSLKSSMRPVLVSLRRSPFRDFSADQTIGRGTKKVVNGVWVDADPWRGLRLGQLADACVYWGINPNVETQVGPAR